MSGRFDAFHALEPEKQKRIINAALAEFSDKGFKRASTNAIAEAAHVGKGMLFYYFGNKEELYDFLCEYTLEYVKRNYLDNVVIETGDFIERQRLLAVEKQRTIREEPLLISLFESFYRPENAEYTAKYSGTLMNFRNEFVTKLYEGVDESLFRADIEPQNAVRYISWLLDGYTSEIEWKMKSGELDTHDESALQDEWRRHNGFIMDLRKLFYKEGK